MEENKVLVTELPLPFDEKDLEELKKSQMEKRLRLWTYYSSMIQSA